MHHPSYFECFVDRVNKRIPTYFLFSFLMHSMDFTFKSFCCDELECKNPQHQNLPLGACKRSFIMTNILNNNRSLSASRNSSFCTRPSGGINHGAHAKRIAQLLLSPTGSLLPSNDCSSCPPRRESTISETVCVCYYPLTPNWAVLYFMRIFFLFVSFFFLPVNFSPTTVSIFPSLPWKISNLLLQALFDLIFRLLFLFHRRLHRFSHCLAVNDYVSSLGLISRHWRCIFMISLSPFRFFDSFVQDSTFRRRHHIVRTICRATVNIFNFSAQLCT